MEGIEGGGVLRFMEEERGKGKWKEGGVELGRKRRYLGVDWLVDWWGWLVGWGWVVWLGLILGVDGLSLVLDVGDVAVVVVGGVGDGLDTAVGKVDGVGSGDSLAVSGLLGVEVGAGVIVGDAVLESVWLGGLVVVSWGWLVGWGWGVVWWWWAGWDGSGGGCEGSED